MFSELYRPTNVDFNHLAAIVNWESHVTHTNLSIQHNVCFAMYL